MNHRDRILATLRGEKTDCLPFVPRLDLWYRANKQNGTLPYKYKNATLMEITEDLDIGYHAVVPDFKDIDSENDEIDRALGIYNLRNMPYRIELEQIERKVIHEKDITSVEYITPFGNIMTKTLYNNDMRKAGITITHILEHAIKSIDDFEAIAFIYKNIRIIPNYDGYDAFNASIGERGPAVGFISLAASPMHLIQRELMPLDTFFFEFFDHLDDVLWLAGQINEYFTQVIDIVSQSHAEILFSGANYDSTITYPPFFDKYICPFLKEQADILHAKGKYLLTHTDGENRGLLELYLKAGIDIADSICPYPMTKLTLKDTRDVFKDKITIWGGLPSICVLKDSMNEYIFEEYLDKTLESIGNGDHFILSLADTTPPSAEFSRIEKIIRACRSFGCIKM